MNKAENASREAEPNTPARGAGDAAFFGRPRGNIAKLVAAVLALAGLALLSRFVTPGRPSGLRHAVSWK